MLSLKEILILSLVLCGSLIIFFSHYQPPTDQNQEQKTAEQISSPVVEDIEIKISTLSQRESQPTEELIEELTKESPLSMEQTETEDDPSPSLKTPSLSLENILAEVENLSSDLWFEYQSIRQEKNGQNCCQPENSPSSICTTILAAPGPGGMLCNCATLGCTPPHGPWCVHPCCFACCQACCIPF